MKAAQRIDWLAWWQLLRAANVFTAASNVIAGFLLVQREWQPVLPLMLLVLTSILLYEAGMVLNDVCDAELDAKERPERPIPSGRVSRQTALRVGIALLVGGVFTAHVVTWLTHQWQSTYLALALAATIVGYNVGVKSTRFGPLAMGGCRLMNVLLGASVGANLATFTENPIAWVYAAVIGLYTMGITILARRETESRLMRGTVTRLIQLFIVFDATVSALAAGWLSGLAVLSLLIPTRFLARKLPMT
ncbi:MAG: UbiA family prenyltransferase [Bythopirellula sp.]|nr:UbiA family prenyltransferase [Bythopirellula sp.]